MKKSGPVCAGLLLFSACGSGCGLLTVPYLQPVVPESLRSIVALDASTQEPLEQASVSVRVHKWDNWIEPMPIWGIGDPNFTPFNEKDEPGVFVLEAKKLSPGVFEIQREEKWATVTIWFPMPSLLGWFLYHSYASQILVEAPGYEKVWVSSTMTPSGLDNSYPEGQTMKGARLEFTGGSLCVFLPESSRGGAVACCPGRRDHDQVPVVAHEELVSHQLPITR